MARLTLPVCAIAQDAEDRNVLDGDHLTLGVGGFYGPSYDGSDDYVLSPFPIIQGRVHGVEITPRQGGVAIDVLPDRKDARIGFRSEEHTSELQSLMRISYAVFCLKKKK